MLESLKTLASFALATGFFAASSLASAATSDGSDISCQQIRLANHWDNNEVTAGELCSLEKKLHLVHGVDPLTTLSAVAQGALGDAKEHCESSGLTLALFVRDFNSNLFEVDSVGVRNTKFGSRAVVTGRFVCVTDGGGSYELLSN